VGYNKHKFARISMAAIHTNTSSGQIQFALIWVVSMLVLFL